MINEKIHRSVVVGDVLLVVVISAALLVMWHNWLAIAVAILLICITGRQLIKEKQRPSDEREYIAMFIAGYFGWLVSFLFIFVLAVWEYAHTGKIGFWFRPILFVSGISFFSLNLLLKARIWD
ncbi:MAG: hypothetical protein L6420_02285 [Elusimicrobia bacterium]|nr:hypothetical protein [Elusimicrobiota bacterium]